MKSVTIKDTVLNDGSVKICIPLVAKNLDEIKKELKNINELEYDILEFRVDHFVEVSNFDALSDALKIIKENIINHPLLFTFRSKQEGGVKEYSQAEYFALLNHFITSNLIDLVDIELFMEKENILETIKLAQENNVKVLMCNHDFDKTPSCDEIVKRLRMMQDYNADICKIAVMPTNENDVMTLLQATLTMKQEYADRPIITMSMGSYGMISRLCGSLTGSCMTFASATLASAPGQIPATPLKTMLDILNIK